MLDRRQRYYPIYLITIALLLILIAGLLLDFVTPGAAIAGGSISWDMPLMVSSTSDNGAFIPVIKGDASGRLLLAYNHMTEQGNENPYYRESTNKGKSWAEPRAIHQSEESLLQVTFTFDSNNAAHAIWRTESGIWHSREDQWPHIATPITSTEQLVFSPDVAIAQDDTLHVVWSQEDNRIYHAYSENAGLNWMFSAALTNGVNKSEEPAVAVDHNGNIHVVWEERIYDPILGNFRFEIQYKHGTVEEPGINWSDPPKVLSTDIVNARMPSILTEGDNIHVAFARRVSEDEQYAYYIQNSSGSGWGAPVDVTQENPVAMNSNVPFVLIPSLVYCDETIYVYFHGSLVVNGKEKILGANSGDNWDNRESVEIGNKRTIRPSLTCTGGLLHMVYEEVVQPNTDHQIYYLSGNRFSIFLPITFRT